MSRFNPFNKSNSAGNMLQEPFVIAHRGGSSVFPEDTMVAYEMCVAAGHRIIEQDVQLLSDGSLGVMHDNTIDRTTTSTGNVNDYSAYDWSKLVVDASAWLPGAQNTEPPLFEDVLQKFGDTVIYVPESKDQLCADRIAQALVKYGLQQNAIIQSGSATDLSKAVPYGIRTMLLTDSYDPVSAKAQGFTYIGHSSSVLQSYVQSCVSAGIKPGVYVLNSRYDFSTWQSYGDVFCFSDDPIWITGKADAYPRTKDPFAHAAFYHGNFATLNGDHGAFLGTNRWGWTGTVQDYVIQGWGSPVANAAATYHIQLTMTVETGNADTTRWGSCAFASTNDKFTDAGGTGHAQSNGYQVLVRQNGEVDLFKIVNGVSTSLGTVSTAAIAVGGTAIIKIDVTPTSITVTRTDVSAPNSIVASDTTFRGGFFFFGHNGIGASFSNVIIS